MAKLYFRYGAMNCGKTTMLLQTANNYEERGMDIIIIKPQIDSKGECSIVSRLGIQRKVDELIKEDTNIYQIVKNNYMSISCLFVDEAQFLNKKQIDELMKVVVALNIPVICYGLRTDFLTNGFEGSTRLLEIAHTIEEIKTVCNCGTKAIFNARKIDDKFTFVGDSVAIDGKNKITYDSLCPKCYYAKLFKYEKIKQSLNNK